MTDTSSLVWRDAMNARGERERCAVTLLEWMNQTGSDLIIDNRIWQFIDAAIVALHGSRQRHCWCLAPAAGKAQHHHEQVDEVEVKRQRTDHGLAARRSYIVVVAVHRLDSLSIVSS